MNDIKRMPRWPLAVIAAPAAVAVWSGWVGLGGMCGFGLVQPFPGIVTWHLNTAITLPVGVEAYGAYALAAWLRPGTSQRARKFAKRSALGALALGMAGQVAFHLLTAAHAVRAPWPVVMLVACLPVVVMGLGTALVHLLREPAGDVPAEVTTTVLPEAIGAVAAGVPQVSTTGEAVAEDSDIAAAIEPDTDEDTEPVMTPATRRTPGRAKGRQSMAGKVATLRAKYPDMTQAQMATRLKVSERTVRRHLAGVTADA